jgi:hypothetical protein
MASTLENALRLVKPGEMVVSITDILDKLGNKITAEDRQQLLMALLSPRRQTVLPGDLITADLLNQILVDIVDLRIWIARVEAGQGTVNVAPVIAQLTPADVVNVGGDLFIDGSNFKQSQKLAVVTIGGAIASIDPGSTDTLLRVKVPKPVVSMSNKVPVIVSNGSASAMAQILVKDVVIVVLEPPTVSFKSMTPDPAAPGKVKIAYGLLNNGYAIDNFVLTPGLKGVNWPARVIDSNGADLANVPVPLAPNAPVTVYVELTVPINTNGTLFQVSLNAKTANTLGDAPWQPIAVGVELNPDPAISFSQAVSIPTVQFKNGVLTLSQQVKSALLDVTIDGEGDVDLNLSAPSLDLASAATGGKGWKFTWLDPAPPNAGDLKASVKLIAGGGGKPLEFQVSADGPTTTSGNLLLTATRAGQSKRKTVLFELKYN